MAADKASEKHFYDLLKKRDPKAMEYLYDQYAPVIYGLILKIARKETIAENLFQKTFGYIWSNYKEFDPDKQNVCVWIINSARKICREEIGFQSFKNNGNDAAIFSSLDKSRLSLSGLPSSVKSKKVFDLLFFGNGSIAEVSKHSNMSELEIRKSLREAMGQLKNVTEKV